MQTDRQRDRETETERQTNRETDRQIDRQKYIQIDSQVGRPSHRQDTQVAIQTDRQV